MGDDRSDEDAEELLPEEPASTLEGLDEDFENLDPLDEHPPSAPPLSQREIDDVVNQVLNEALSRLGGTKGKP
jgi:hypothetical protein